MIGKDMSQRLTLFHTRKKQLIQGFDFIRRNANAASRNGSAFITHFLGMLSTVDETVNGAVALLAAGVTNIGGTSGL